MDTNDQHLLSIEEAAARLNVSVPTVRRWIRLGRVPARQYVKGGVIRIDPADLEREPEKMTWMSPS